MRSPSVPSSRTHNAATPGVNRVTALSPAGPLNPITAIERKDAPAQIAQVVRPAHDEIAKAAYLRWLKEGGDAESNWVAAERELSTLKPA